MLYETRPETVAFVLRRPVPTYSRNEQEALLAALEQGPTALIAPLKQAEFWRHLPYRRAWRGGADVLLEVPKLEQESSDSATPRSAASSTPRWDERGPEGEFQHSVPSPVLAEAGAVRSP